MFQAVFERAERPGSACGTPPSSSRRNSYAEIARRLDCSRSARVSERCGRSRRPRGRLRRPPGLRRPHRSPARRSRRARRRSALEPLRHAHVARQARRLPGHRDLRRRCRRRGPDLPRRQRRALQARPGRCGGAEASPERSARRQRRSRGDLPSELRRPARRRGRHGRRRRGRRQGRLRLVVPHRRHGACRTAGDRSGPGLVQGRRRRGAAGLGARDRPELAGSGLDDLRSRGRRADPARSPRGRADALERRPARLGDALRRRRRRQGRGLPELCRRGDRRRAPPQGRRAPVALDRGDVRRHGARDGCGLRSGQRPLDRRRRRERRDGDRRGRGDRDRERHGDQPRPRRGRGGQPGHGDEPRGAHLRPERLGSRHLSRAGLRLRRR